MKNVIGRLIDAIGIRLTTYIANETDAKKVKEWAEGSLTPNIDQMEILVVTNMIVVEFTARESESLAVTFLTGSMYDDLNRRISPAQALRDGRTNEVMAHMRRVLNGEWD